MTETNQTSWEQLSSPMSDRPQADKRLPLLWRAFFASATIMVGAAVLLAVTPVTIHAPITLGQLAIVLGGLAVMLVVNLWVLRQSFDPTSPADCFDGRGSIPTRPGERITDLGSYGPESPPSSDAFNQMLDRSSVSGTTALESLLPRRRASASAWPANCTTRSDRL